MATLLLNKTSDYNNIPNEFIPELPEQGKTVIFQYLKKIYDPVAGAGHTPLEFYPNDCQFRGLGRFRNPKTKEWIKIGFISFEDEKKQPVTSGDERALLTWRPAETDGYFMITLGNNPLLDQFYQYLMLSSEVEGNNLTDEMRDTTVTPIVKLLDPEKKAREEMELQDLEFEAYGIAANLTPTQIRDIAYTLGYGKELSDSVVKSNIRSFAKANPALFLQKVNDTDGGLKARILQALDLGIVEKDLESKTIRMADKSKAKVLQVADFDTISIQNAYVEACKKPDFLKNMDAKLESAIKQLTK